jgi:hypothetical protein
MGENGSRDGDSVGDRESMGIINSGDKDRDGDGKKTTQTEKTTAKMEKRMVETKQTVEGTWKTTMVNKKMEWEFLYQNHHNTRQTDGRMILYNSKKGKMNREWEQRLVH